MIKLLRSKKATNDVTYIWTIITILFTLGIFVPIIENYFTDISTEYNVEGVTEDVSVDMPKLSVNPLTIVDLGVSILSMFFWSFNVHWIINLVILMPMRIMLYLLLYRQIRSGGG